MTVFVYAVYEVVVVVVVASSVEFRLDSYDNVKSNK